MIRSSRSSDAFLVVETDPQYFGCVASSGEKRLSAYPAELGVATTEPSGTLRGYVIQTATITKRTSVYAYEPAVSRSLLAVLPKGAEVELVEDDTSELLASVHVIVPGFGLGLVPKAHLKEITTHNFPGHRKSCITALHYESDRSNDAVATGFIDAVLPSLRHVRVKPPQAFLEQLLPQVKVIESIDCCEFSARSLESMHRLRHLQSLGLSCTADQLDQVQSAIRSAFTGDTARSRCPLRALRLIVDTWDASNADWKLAMPLLSTAVREELKGLQVLEIAFREEHLLQHHALDQFAAELPPSQPGLAMRKLNFLWALRTWRPECAAGLDAYVIAIIFGYCGPNFDRAAVSWSHSPVDLSLDVYNEML